MLHDGFHYDLIRSPILTPSRLALADGRHEIPVSISGLRSTS
jgi:hypothetical protein